MLHMMSKISVGTCCKLLKKQAEDRSA